MNSLDLLPPTASAYAAQLTAFFWVMVAICGVVATAIAVFIIHCAIRYRRRYPNELPEQIPGATKIELTWTFVPLVIFLGMFGWGAKAYFDVEQPPPDAIDIWVVGKQWMWKLQHMNGAREIDTLHVPVGRPVRLTMISEDVIHSFYVPAFRVKQDVLPQRYTTIWFTASKAGKYHLFCAEYCGTKHSGMIGWVYAMDPQQYQLWISQGGAEGSLASTGLKLFHQFGCANCHRFTGHGPGPNLQGLYGSPVLLADGTTVIADQTYIRECILRTKPALVAGFTSIMPNFKGQLSEEQVVALIAYIRAMGPQAQVEMPASPGTTLPSYGREPGIAGPGSSSIAGTKPDSR